jgi:magnesium-transporting ATPase (P-type)
MSNSSQRIVSISLYVIFGISVILAIWFFAGGYEPGTQGTSYEEPVATNTMLLWGYFLFGITALAAIIFPIINLISHPKNAKQALIVVAIFAAIILISYALSSGTPLNLPGYKGEDNVPAKLHMVGTGLYATYFLGGIAFLGILASEIYRIFR